MRSAALLLALHLLSWLCSAESVAQPVTDPKAAVSPVRPEFVSADPKELAALDEPGYPAWSPDGRFIAYTSYRSGPQNVWLTDVVTKKSQAPWIQAFARGLIGDPIGDQALWRNRSPLTHAARIRAPVLMDAGVNDTRTPLAQIKEKERAIRENGGLVELHVIGDSGHFTADTEAYVDSNMMVVRFLDRHLRGGARQAPVGN